MRNVFHPPTIRSKKSTNMCSKDNGYPANFLPNCCKPVTSSRNISVDKVSTTSSAFVAYIRGVTEPIRRILASHNVIVAQKCFQTLEHIFSKPKDCVPSEQRTSSVYPIPWKDYEHEYIVQTSSRNRPYSWVE